VRTFGYIVRSVHLLSCYIADFDLDLTTPTSLVWAPRNYATVWRLAHSLSNVKESISCLEGHQNSTARWRISGWSLYSDTELLARKIASIAKVVTFHDPPPTTPFDTIQLGAFSFLPDRPRSLQDFTVHEAVGVVEDEAFDIEFEDPIDHFSEPEGNEPRRAEPTLHLQQCPVDERLSCSYHQDCTLHPRANSIYCLWHHRIVAETCPETFLTIATIARPDLVRQETVKFTKPESLTDCKHVRTLHEITKNFIVWIIDTEFFSIPGKTLNFVPWQVAVRDGASGKIILSSLVDYDSMNLEDMMEEMDKYDTPASANAPQRFRRTIEQLHRNYHGPQTTGLGLGAIGEALIEAGFHADTHRVISWYSPMDMQVFSRAIRGDSDLISARKGPKTFFQLHDTSGRPSLQPINLGHLVKRCSNLLSGSMGYVHRSLFDTKRLLMHEAENDTLAMYDVYQRFLRETKHW
jgi:hypothetical protein